MLLNNTYTHTHTHTRIQTETSTHLAINLLVELNSALERCLDVNTEFVPWVPSRGSVWLAASAPATVQAIRTGTEEVVMRVVVEDGAEMGGGNGRVEGRSEMLFPQNSWLIISPL